MYKNDDIESISGSRKDSIVRCASELFLKKGYDRTSIRDVARESGISMGALYHYIGTKENLLVMVAEHHDSTNNQILEDIGSAIKSCDPEEALLRAIRVMLEAIDNNKKGFVFIFTETKLMPKPARSVIQETERNSISVFKRILGDGKKEKIFRFSDPELMAHHIISMIQMWGVKWWFFKGRSTIDDFYQSLINFVLPAVRGAN